MLVYFIRTTEGPPLVKIGKTANLAKRIESLKTGCPYPLELVGTLSCRSDMHARSIEKQLHRMHQWARTQGEWFRYDRSMRAGIERVLSGHVEEIYKNALSGWRSCR